MNISGYQISEEVHVGANSLVYRGVRNTDNHPVVLKVLKQAYPPPEQIAWFKREYEITRNLNLPGVVEAYSLDTAQQWWVMVLEDFGGESLARLEIAGTLGLTEFLKLVIQVADVLGQVHRRNIIHKDINPAHIVFNATTGQIKLIDFGISTALSRENPAVRNPNVLEGTPAYMSPEQTGRMNRAMDYRTDFYSLGAAMYELLTGQVPFPTTDPIELVHCHIARQPQPPHKLKPDIPQAVSDIVLKLLAKNAEDRYQSAYGLKVDLEECLRQWQAAGRIISFPLGGHDVSDRFQIPGKLYGRKAEIATLLAGFERACQGRSELVLVSGPPGIGKTTLVHEIYKPMTRQRGYFVSGKFDQLQRNVPYSALIQAFQSLMQQLLTESEVQIAAWHEKILAALGPNGQVVLDVIPEVELIVGPQLAAPELPSAEAQNRFNLVFQNFIHVFARPEHPLVIFLDGLQWADVASLNLLRLLMTASDSQTFAFPQNKCLFLIGAYRDNEVDPAHPLMLTVDQVRQAGATVNHISLSPLDLPDVTQFISDTLNCAPERASPLAELVLDKTRGNPFFMTEFLQSLYAEELIHFDYERKVWQWDLAQMQTRDMTDNVVGLLVGKIQELEAGTQQVLQLAACIGNQFDLQTLAIVYEKSPRDTAADLGAAIAEGLVLPLGEAYKLMALDVPELVEGLKVEYQFAHVRIQQAVYSLIAAERKQVVHFQVGRWLLQTIPPDRQEQRIFDIVNQLNQGRDLITEQAEQDELAELNLRAGQKAKSAAGYEPAFNYSQVGVGLLGEDGWQRHATRDLALALHVQAAEAAYLSGDFGRMEQLAETVLARAETLLDKVKVYEVKIQAYIAQNRLLEAVQTALPVLKLLGIRFPEKPSKLHILLAMLETKLTLAGKRIEGLGDLPEMTDPYKMAAMRILSCVGSAAYFAVPDLLPLVVFKSVNLSVKHGYASESAFVYAAYGLILCGSLGDIDAGYRFGKLALSLLEQFDTKTLKARTLVMFNLFIRHWKEHVRESLQPLLGAYQSGLEMGDLEYAAIAVYLYCFNSHYIGKELTGLEREMAAYNEVIVQLKQETILHQHEIYRQVVLNLLGRAAAEPYRLSGETYDEEKMLPLYLEANDRAAIFQLHFNKLVLCYLFQEYLQGLENAAVAEKYLDGATGQLSVPVFYFYDSLVRLAVFPETPNPEQKHLLRKVVANQKKMQKWAQHAPMNHQHKFYLVEAERSRVLGQGKDAREYYDQAIALARENGYVHEEALAYELAARFYFDRGQSHLAGHYLRDAHYAYQQWGAVAKVNDLEARYPQMFAETSLTDAALVAEITTSGRGAPGALDLTSVMKASQAISGEIVLERLLAQLMQIVIENAGAQKGFLILEEEGRLVVEAGGAVDQAEVVTLQSIPVEAADRVLLPTAIVNYVARTGESIILNNAIREGLFTVDPYVVENQPQSILCIPLAYQSKLIGILYLENNLTPGTFTPDRVQVLQLLSAQAAIAIKNAQLYEEAQQEIAKRVEAGLSLLESEARYRTLFDGVPVGLYRTTPAGQLVDINLAMVQMLGYPSREELLAINSANLYANPEERGRWQALLEREEAVRFFEIRCRRYDGTLIWVNDTARAVRDERGQLLYYEGSLEDITERRQTRQRLKESEEEFRTLYEATRDAVMLLDEVSFFDCNPATLKIFGCETKEQFVGKHPSQFSPEYQLGNQDSVSLAAQRIETALREGSCFFEWQHKRLDGTEFPAEVLLSAMEIKGRKVLQAVVRDITKRKQAETELRRYREHLEELVEERTTELRESEERYHTLFDGVPVGLYRSTPAGQSLDANLAFLQIMNYPNRETLLATRVTDEYVNPEDRVRWQALMEREGVVRDFEYQLRRYDGAVIWVSDTARVVKDEQGQILYYEGSIEDITVRKRAEEELRRAKEAAEAANRAKSAFLANMSHELRTPLNAIIGFTRLVKRRSEEVLPRKQLDNLEKVLVSATRLLELINAVLELSKIEAGRVDVRPSTFEVAILVDICLQTVWPVVESRDLRLVKEIEPDLPALFTDQDKVRKILTNFLDNATKFTEAGTITVSARQRDGMLVLAVADTGSGIPKEALGRIFGTFQQVDDSATRRYGGTGLGLSISRHLARLLGGDVAVESIVGIGSTFTVTLPIRYDGTSPARA